MNKIILGGMTLVVLLAAISISLDQESELPQMQDTWTSELSMCQLHDPDCNGFTDNSQITNVTDNSTGL